MSRSRRRVRAVGFLAASWSALYVSSKIGHAIQGRLGVTGGPEVPADAYARYGADGVVTAQLGNAAVGLIILLVALLSVLPVARRVNRWIVTVPLAVVVLLLAIAWALFLGRALITSAGGGVFGLYCLVWCALYSSLLLTHYRDRS